MRIRATVLAAVCAAAMLCAAASVLSQEKMVSDAQYVAQALSAAPRAIAAHAAVVRMDKDGKMRTLRKGTNGFTCVVMNQDRMCNDENAMQFFMAAMTHGTPTDKPGFSYMLAGDHGTSNTDPFAAKKTATNHWIVTGPHLMLTGAAAKMLGYTREQDPDPNQPYMMWVGTAYEHAMIPVGPPNASKP
ncbi:MAG: hypothetical protein WB460_07970 [Candidatus Acidiferrales bacterium]